MENKVQLVGNLDGVKLFYDPLRKPEEILIMRKSGEIKIGHMVTPVDNLNEVDIILESNSRTTWDNVTGVIAGFNDIDLFKKIKEQFYEENK